MLTWPEGEEPEYEAVADASKFGRYEKREDAQTTSMVQGWIVKPPPGAPKRSRWVIDLEEEEPIPEFVPAGFKRKEVSLEFVKRFIPVPAEVVEDLESEGAVEASKIVYECARPYYLTKREFMAIPSGRAVPVYFFDRNWGDQVLNWPRGNKKAFKTFFAGAHGTLARNKTGDKMTIKWDWVDEPFELDTEIMYAKDSWYPLRNGVLPALDEQGIFKLIGKPVKWSDIKPDVNVGYRGPIVLAKYAAKLPKYAYQLW